MKLTLDGAQQVQRKNIQYSTGFTLAPGKYHLKFVMRENQTGAMGSFETDLQVPDLKKSSAEVELRCTVESARAEYGEEDGEPAGARWGGVDPQRAARVSARPAPLFPVRGVRPGEGEGCAGAGEFSGADSA